MLFRSITLFLCVSFNVFSINEIELNDSNRNEIKKTINNLPLGFEMNYGLKDRSQIDSLEIGSVIYMYYLSDTSLINQEKAFCKLDNILIPIILKDEIIFFVKGLLDKNCELKLFGLGGNLFATDVNKIIKTYDTIENVSILHDYSTGQSYLFNKDELQSENEFNLFIIGANSKCFACQTLNDKQVSSTKLVEHFINKTKHNENESKEFFTN